MKKLALLPLALIAAAPPAPAPVLSPNEIVAAAKAEEWTAIAPTDLLVMDLAADRDAKPRRVVIQLMPAPFSQGWIGNIRTLAAARWWDGTSVNRVQDNYVVQWGDVSEKKALPTGLAAMQQDDYRTAISNPEVWHSSSLQTVVEHVAAEAKAGVEVKGPPTTVRTDIYGNTAFHKGWPVGFSYVGQNPETLAWPVHCYGMVGVGRNMPPDTGTGAELYTVIGHAPRHLDRNIALVGRVISGIEHLSSLPRGTGDLGFYKTAAERVPILSVRVGDQVTGLPRYDYLSTESASFAAYADARANRRDAFFITPAGGADICNIPVPVRVGR